VRGLVALLVASMALAGAPMAAESATLPPGGTFFDDDGNVHEGAIEAIAAAGVTRGCGVEVDDLFCPSRVVTRGQMAAFLRRALDLPASPDDVFADDDASVFEADIQAIAAAGITRGCGAGRFCPERPVLRGEMAAFLTRAFGYPASDDDSFVDDDDSVFQADIQALAAAGVTKGCGAARYCPEDPVRRDEMASFLTRALRYPPIVVQPRPVVSVAFTGDTLIHLPVTERAEQNGDISGRPYDFAPMFEPVEPLLEAADLAICHLEVPLSPSNTGLSGYPTFNAPRDLAAGLAEAGFDGCSTASNHSIDQGAAGVVATLDVLDDAGLAHAGTARSQAEADQAAVYRIGDLTIAHLSATWWLNGLSEPGAMPWLVENLDVDRLLERARAAKEAGADFVVVSVHCCTEYQTEPTTYQRQVDRALLDSPHVDLVVGHHAHVVQPIERRGDEFIVYGLGNFVSAQRRLPETIDGVVVIVEVAERHGAWVTRAIRYAPTWVEAGTYRVLPAAETITSGTAGALEETLRASWSRTSRTILGFRAQPVTPLDRP